MGRYGKLRQLLGEDAWSEYQQIRKNEKACRWSCKNSDHVIRWRQRLKQKLIDYKGGKCIKCEYDKNVPSAYVFHHRCPKEKEFGIGEKGCPRSFERCKKEADKCDLLCTRCHAEKHHEEYEISKDRTIHQFESLVKKWTNTKEEFLRTRLGDKAQPFIDKIRNSPAFRAICTVVDFDAKHDTNTDGGEPMLPAYISIDLDLGSRNERRRVKTADYVRAKTKQLREFGYGNLDESAVKDQLKLLLAGKKWTDIIGGFMEKDKPQKA